MKRREAEKDLLAKRQAEDKLIGGRELSPGYYRKQKPFDCGRTKCGICHSDKVCGHEQTRDEELADIREAEQIEDLEPPDPRENMWECQGYSGCPCADCSDSREPPI